MTRKVLITGGCGFIGRHLARELLDWGYEVRILDSVVEQVHGKNPPDPIDGVEQIFGDVREKKVVNWALGGVTHVVHLAAEVGVGQSQYEIARYVGANDLGTAVLLEAAIDSAVERIVVASSMSVYGEGLYRDGHGRIFDDVRRDASLVSAGAWNPRSPSGEALEPVATPETKPVDLASIYALTKFVQERAVLLFGRAYGRDAVALRLFNVYGPGQALANPYTGVLANFASRIANGEAPLIFEDGLQRRDLVHVRDVARAFRLALDAPGIGGETINVGSGRSLSVAEVASMLIDAMGADGMRPEILGRARSGDIRHCFADIGKARELLGFVPMRRIEDELDEIVDWVAGAGAIDNAHQMRRELEARGLVS